MTDRKVQQSHLVAEALEAYRPSSDEEGQTAALATAPLVGVGRAWRAGRAVIGRYSRASTD